MPKSYDISHLIEENPKDTIENPLLQVWFSNSLTETANNIVKNVGEESNMAWAVTGEEFKEVVFMFKDENEIIEQWASFIKSYVIVVQNTFTGSIKTTMNRPTIYWRIKPEIKENEDRSGYLLYARLLISTFQRKVLR